MTSSLSVLRLRSRVSSAAREGGRMKMVRQSGMRLADLVRALPVDLEDHVVPGVAQRFDLRAARAVEVVEHLRVLEEFARGDAGA